MNFDHCFRGKHELEDDLQPACTVGERALRCGLHCLLLGAYHLAAEVLHSLDLKFTNLPALLRSYIPDGRSQLAWLKLIWCVLAAGTSVAGPERNAPNHPLCLNIGIRKGEGGGGSLN